MVNLTDKELKDLAAVDPMMADFALEIIRLRNGDLTAPEFHNLCHNKEKSVSPAEFCNECEKYSQKLFGESEITRLKEEIFQLKLAISSHLFGHKVIPPEFANLEYLKK